VNRSTNSSSPAADEEPAGEEEFVDLFTETFDARERES